jgi:cytidine deaminase
VQRLTWAPIGAGGTVLHAIAVVHSGSDTAVALCGNDGQLRAPDQDMTPCANCQQTLKALVDTMPSNATV